MSRRIVVLTGRAGAGKTTVANYLNAECGFARVRFANALKSMAAALGLNHDEIEGHLKEMPSPKLTLDAMTARVSETRAVGDAFDLLLRDDVEQLVIRHGFMHEPDLFNGRTLVYAITSFQYVVLACCAKGGEQGASPRSLMQMIGTEWGRDMISKTLWIDAWAAEVAGLPQRVNIVVDDCRFPNEAQAASEMGEAVFFRVMRQGVKLAGDSEKAHASEQNVIGYHYKIENNRTPADAGEAVRHLFHGTLSPDVFEKLRLSYD